ncbi:hypothetical protein LXL04_030509 [Taraxacum kok-saghyz]
MPLCRILNFLSSRFWFADLSSKWKKTWLMLGELITALPLTTKPGSGLLINPPVADDLQYKENKAEILQVLEKESYKDGDLLMPYPEEEDIIPITEAIASLKTSKTAWVKGRLKLVNQDKPFSHTGCANCLKPLDADITWIVTCPSCKTESEVLPISRASVQINDGTGKIRGTISTPDIEKFIPFTLAQLKDAKEFVTVEQLVG